MQSPTSRACAAVLWVWLAQAACAGNSPGSFGITVPDFGPGQSVSKAVDAGGGAVTVPGGAAAVTIPAGALSGSTAVTVTLKDRTLSPNAKSLGSQVFDFGPPGTQFLHPVSMVLKALDPPPTGQRAVLAFVNAQGKWQVVPGSTYNADTQSVTAAVSHFTDFAVFYIDAQGAGCAGSPDPSAFCSPDVCDTANNVCGPQGSVALYHVGGTAAGLAGGNVVLSDNGSDTLTVSGNGSFVFANALSTGTSYSVTVVQQPVGRQCTLTGAEGTVAASDVTSVALSCAASSYPLGGRVQGLVGATQVALQNGNDAISAGNGNFTFPTPVAYGTGYAASLTSPANQVCAFVGASQGTMGAAPESSLVVNCAPSSFNLGGSISGLVGPAQVIVMQGADTLTIGNGSYILPTAVAYGSAYHLITTSPPGQACRFADGNTYVNAVMPAANVTNADLACVPATYSVGGSVSGLVGQGNVVLHNGADTISVYNGAYTFPTSVVYGGMYTATLVSPAGQTCSFTNQQSGTVGSANVTTVAVACTPRTYTVGGTVSGLVSNNQVQLQNGADTISVSNGAYTLPTSVAYAADYSVFLTTPAGQLCNFSPLGSNIGTMGPGNVTNVNVVCGTQAYTLGGSVSGLINNTTVTLNDGTDTLNVGNAPFTFPTRLIFGSTYSVTATSPAGQSCTFNGASTGTMPANNVTSLSVGCVTLSYRLGGTVSGLVGAGQVTLRNGGDSLSVGNADYLFPTRINYGAGYNVGLTSPAGQNCVFSPGGSNAGTMPAADVTGANVVCTPVGYTLGGAISGLVPGTMVTVQDGTDTVQLGAGPFTFPTSLAYNSAFTVSITAPAGQQCTLGGTQTGPMPAANVSDITVSCSPISYSIGGAVTGLMYNGSLLLQNGSDILNVSNGPYTLPTQVPFNTGYNVILRVPGGQSCTFTGGGTAHAGTMPAANIVDINVNCVLVPYSISINAPGSVVTATPFAVTISMLDLAGNVLTGYTGTLQFSSSDPQGSPGTTPQDVVFDNTSQGVVTVNNVSLTALGQQMLTANDAADQVQGEAGVNVTSMLRAGAAKDDCGLFASGVEPGEPELLSATKAATRTRHAVLWPPFAPAGLRVADGYGVTGSKHFIALQGVGVGASPTHAGVDAFDVQERNIVLDGASYASYWVFPVSDMDTDAALELLFEDGTHASARGTSRPAPGTWNHVHAPLGAFAGKRVQRLALRWSAPFAPGPFDVRFDAVHVVGAGCVR